MARPRKRRAFKALLAQVERLFVIPCRLLAKELAADKNIEYLELTVEEVIRQIPPFFCTVFCMDEQFVRKVIGSSKHLMIDETNGHIRRSSTAPSCWDCSIFVDSLPEDTEENWLRDYFSRYGCVFDVHLPVKRISEGVVKAKRFAFIQFSDVDAVAKACNEHCIPTVDQEASCGSGYCSYERRKERRRRTPIIGDVSLNDKTFRGLRECLVYRWNEWYKLKQHYLRIQKENFGHLKRTLVYRKCPPLNSSVAKRLRGRDKLIWRAHLTDAECLSSMGDNELLREHRLKVRRKLAV
uniref:RRM domain-containing protein n=1 Tax=Trichuris muris TaxID=70415 RepID=A0A5S6Q966_TRIMR